MFALNRVRNQKLKSARKRRERYERAEQRTTFRDGLPTHVLAGDETFQDQLQFAAAQEDESERVQ